MPPGKALLEVLFGRSGIKHARQKAPSRAAGRNAGRTEAQHQSYHTTHIPHASQAVNASNITSSASGRLVGYLVDIFSPLVRAPGVGKAGVGRNTLESISQKSARNPLFNPAAGLHTAARSRGVGGFGNVRPNALPRSTSQLGLGKARNFSSSRAVFDNVVQNAPLGLRVLGETDRLDMRSMKREMRRAHMKKQKQAAQLVKCKGKGKLLQGLPSYLECLEVPTSMDEYFPIDQTARSAIKPSVQLNVSLDFVPEETRFISMTEEGGSSRIFSTLLMSDLRLLHDLRGRHQARVRNLLHKLQSAGCFDVDTHYAQPSVRTHLGSSNLRITFYGQQWSIADVRQILGLYGSGDPSWFELLELSTSSETAYSEDDTHSLPSSLPSYFGADNSPNSITRAVSPEGSYHLGMDGYDAADRSLHMPTYSENNNILDTCTAFNNAAGTTESYVFGITGFLSELEASHRPSFKTHASP